MADSKEEILYQLKIEENRALRSLQKVNEAVKSLDRRKKEYKETVKDQVRLETQLASIRKQRIQINKGVEKSVKGLTKAQQKQSDATGSATSATMELSRVISDAPYGIRGMANNITQLVSQLGTASTKAGGLGGALELMIKQLTGPLGVVFAITAAISALDYFFGANKKAEESVKDLNEELKQEDIILKELVKRYNEFSKIQGTNESVTRGLAEHSKELKKVLSDENLTLEEKNELVKEFVKLKKLEIDNENRATKIKNINKKIEEETNKFRDENQQKLANVLGTRYEEQVRDKLKKQLALIIDPLKSESDEALKIYVNTLTTISKLRDSFNIPEEEKGKKISPFKTKEALDLDVENNLTAIQKLQRQTELINLKTEEQNYINSAESEEDKLDFKEFYASKRLKIELDYELKAIDAKEAAEKASVRKKATIRIKQLEDDLVKYKKNLKDKGVADTAAGKESIAKATKEVEEKVALTKTEAERTVQQITEEYAKLFPFWAQMADARRNALGVGSGEEREEPKVKELDKLQTYVEEYKKLMSGVTEFLDGEFERQLTIEQNKTNVLNKELNDRLINENLSAEQRKNIQNQIAQNDENLRVKQDAINKKKFKQTKALNLSMALIDTYAGATQVLADKKLPSWAKIPMMVSIIGAGLAQVAAISRQKFQSSSAATPINTTGSGAVGGASERAEPSFNIVGRSNDNLLINAIQAQFGKPLKAYVVSRDVTTQQQLDGMIVGQAGT
jgi:type IV secretory pathway VirB2 component (pilin)